MVNARSGSAAVLDFTVSTVSANAVSAAVNIFGRMTYASQHDRILMRASDAFAAADFSDTLARVTLLDGLYGTNLMARSRMARHISSLGDLTHWSGEKCVVETIADLPVEGGRKPRRHLSFAAKYAHFFVDPGRFHILDDAAVRLIARHTGAELSEAKRWSYGQFSARTEAVRLASHLPADRSLDRYLWVGGMRLRQKAGRPINTELSDALKSVECRQDLKTLDQHLR